jgi:DNA-directed RNA polymerase subunit RPC12/RpoP
MIKEIKGRPTCSRCGYEWSAMMADHPIKCQCSDDRLTDVHEEYKRLRSLQYNYEWADKPEAARVYQLQALEKKKLLNKGIWHEPNF